MTDRLSSLHPDNLNLTAQTIIFLSDHTADPENKDYEKSILRMAASIIRREAAARRECIKERADRLTLFDQLQRRLTPQTKPTPR